MSVAARARTGLVVALVLALLPFGLRAASFDDPLATQAALPDTPAKRVVASGLMPCVVGAVDGPLTVLDAVRRALCHHPQTRQAWAAVEARNAAVGVGKAAYLPTLGASASVSQAHAKVTYPDAAVLNSTYDGRSDQERLSLDWVLFDFGLRAANLRHERALLDAAGASLDDTVQAVFLEAARAYYAAAEAEATLATKAEAERIAARVVDVVEAKLEAGVGQEVDRLQARTALANASLDRIRAAQRVDAALAAVAVASGIRPGTPIVLAGLVDAPPPDDGFDDKVDRLIQQAVHAHPRIAAAQSQLDAARETVAATRAAGRPTVSVAAVGDRSNTPLDRVATEQTIETSSIGLNLTIPLFEGFGRHYRIRQAEAEVEGRKADLFAAQQDVAQTVWDSYVTVRGSAREREAVAAVLDTANRSFELALGRYESGVGNIIELLNAQSALAGAREQDVVVRARSRLARLQLAASLGRLDFALLRR